MDSGFLPNTLVTKNSMDQTSEQKKEDLVYPPTLGSEITEDQFWKSLKVYVEKSHVVNRALCAMQPLYIGSSENLIDAKKLLEFFSQTTKTSLHSNFLRELGLKEASIDLQTIWNKESTSKYTYIIRKAIPKNVKAKKQVEVIVLDKINLKATFMSEDVAEGPKILPELLHVILCTEQGIQLSIYDSEENPTCSHWLKTKLLPRIGKWAEQSVDPNQTQLTTGSLTQIDISAYNDLYHELKDKYSSDLLANWEESTDPLKFIYEDLAIASYLIITWRREQREKNLERKQTFLDMGCGNGLLVYILAKEGYNGTGIDLRKRKIWDTFPENVTLKEEVLDPSDDRLFPEYDWLIGNHSDELTPWIPVIALKSNYRTNFFVLPCCPFDFYSKFQRKLNQGSLYSEYMDFVKNVVDICQFDAVVDKLRIPSTKRTCIISRGRNYPEEKWASICKDVDMYVGTRKSVVFKPRDVQEPVKNCTNIDELTKLDIVNTVVNMLLGETNFIETGTGGYSKKWNKGGSLKLPEMASKLSFNQLRNLKKGCGGLQTFLRNHPHVFQVRNATVSLKVPSLTCLTEKAAENIRTKNCWFFQFHPQGCLLEKDQCPYRH